MHVVASGANHIHVLDVTGAAPHSLLRSNARAEPFATALCVVHVHLEVLESLANFFALLNDL